MKFGNTYWLFLNSQRVATELLEKRAAKYSSRMNLPMAFDLVSGGKRTLLMPYGDLWRKERKIMHQILNTTQKEIFAPFQDLESRALLFRYLERPGEWWRLHGLYANAIIVNVVFGKRPHETDPDLLALFQTTSEFVKYLIPGNSIIDLLPFLIKIPWFKPLQPWRWYGDDLYRRTLGCVTV